MVEDAGHDLSNFNTVFFQHMSTEFIWNWGFIGIEMVQKLSDPIGVYWYILYIWLWAWSFWMDVTCFLTGLHRPKLSAKYVSLLFISSFQNSIIPKTGHTQRVSSQVFHEGPKLFRSIVLVTAFYIPVCSETVNIWYVSPVYITSPSGHTMYIL